MKTIETTSIKADPVIREVRRAKVALAQKYDFDVRAMVRALRERDENEKCEQGTGPNVLPHVGHL